MAQNTRIGWTDHSLNFWHGCTKISPGCKYCYMYRDKQKYGQQGSVIQKTKMATVNKVLKEAKPGDKIFVSSWTDFFLQPDNASPLAGELRLWRQEAWAIIKAHPHLIFQILTKRPENIATNLPPDWGQGYPNVWLGVSIESDGYVPRIEQLYAIPAVLRFASCEPLLGSLDSLHLFAHMLDWIIIGGESGNNIGEYRYRPCMTAWFDHIMGVARDAGVPVFMKQMGTHIAHKDYLNLKARHGDDPAEWPERFQVQEFPKLK